MRSKTKQKQTRNKPKPNKNIKNKIKCCLHVALVMSIFFIRRNKTKIMSQITMEVNEVPNKTKIRKKKETKQNQRKNKIK